MIVILIDSNVLKRIVLTAFEQAKKLIVVLLTLNKSELFCCQIV